MHAFGFYISELRFKGHDVIDSIVRFGPGVTAITGPSDTGKSLICDAVNYVFGASTPLKNVTERGHYSRILVEIKAYSGAIFTLERHWDGGDVLLYEVSADFVRDETPRRAIAAKHNPSSKDTVSSVLLELSGLQDYKVRRNAKSETRGMSFRDLTEYALVSEERIITTASPIHSGQYPDKTVESSIFRAILTGLDDSKLISKLTGKSAKIDIAARREVLGELHNTVRSRIATLGRTEAELVDAARIMDRQIGEQSRIVQAFNADTKALEARRRAEWEQKERAHTRLNQIKELLARFELLQQKYDSDLERLMSNLEAGSLLGELEEGPCPLCGAEPAHHTHELHVSQSEVEQLTIACEAEAKKIHQRKSDLVATVERLRGEEQELEAKLPVLENQIKLTVDSLKTIIQPDVASIRMDLSDLMQSRREVDQGLGLFDEMRRLEGMLNTLTVEEGAERGTKESFTTISDNAYDAFSVAVETTLRAWSYPELGRVFFDAVKEDLVISGKARSDHGKGYRAITYAAFMISVLKECRRLGLPHPGFVILDSPLVTYREPEENIGESLKSAFYRDLTKLGHTMQVIVLENIEPPADLKGQVSHTAFTKSRITGRYGLLPQEMAEGSGATYVHPSS